MRNVILGLMIFMLVGCVTVQREITGESPAGDKYEYKASVTAFGGGSAEKAAQAMRGEMNLYYPDGTPKAEVSLDSTQEGIGLSSDSDLLMAIIKKLPALIP